MNTLSVDPCFVMTVDVDSWSSLLRFYSVHHNPTEADAQVDVTEGLTRLLRLFEENEIEATFFVPGEVALRRPSAVKMISSCGHEVACHGYSHDKNEFLLDRASQKKSIDEATKLIEKHNGSQPRGFRAPCLRINETTLAVLEDAGYIYDSSIIPTFVPGYYGHLGSRSRPYRISRQHSEHRLDRRILEIPVSVNPLIPFSLSAAWMRNFGSSWVKLGIRTNFAIGNPVVFYIHPRDVVSLPKIAGVPWHLYRNVGDSALRMLEEIIVYAKELGAEFRTAVGLASTILNNPQR